MKFLRQLIAIYRVWRAPEYGGRVYDFKNGKLEDIYEWNFFKGTPDEASEIVNSMINGGRDEIYITAVSSGPGRGYVFVEYTGKNFPWFRAFWDNIYTAEEALIEALAVSRKYADKLGFRRPEGQ